MISHSIEAPNYLICLLFAVYDWAMLVPRRDFLP